MFTAYLYKTEKVEDACRQFLLDYFSESYIVDIIENLDCLEFVKESLLKKEYLDGEIITEDNHTAIVVTNTAEDLDINTVNPTKTYPIPK